MCYNYFRHSVGGLQMNRVYHIYSKNEVLYHSLEREEFEETWDILSRVMNNLSYEELDVHRDLEASY